MQTVLNGEDVLALLPTGGGKSLCYQVPAMKMEGLCLVISPLIALMKDQVEQLRRRNITAFAIYSGLDRREVQNTFRVAAESNCKFLYVSPERLETTLFKEWLSSFDISLIAVDEAHCISQWGYDFRPPYLRIAALREELPGVPVMALTASATPSVQEDIMIKLQFGKHQVFRQSFARPNLSYQVKETESKNQPLVDLFNQSAGTGLVYCKTRKRTREISELLKMHGLSADFYHAGLSHAERNQKQEDWIQNRTRIMCCTNAFGMGIDKPDVRLVVHADIPDCLENYYQEAGRAGRDGQAAKAILLYHPSEIDELRHQPSVKFPPLETIRQVYQSVANYIQLPEGSGAGTYHDFDYLEFLKRFKLSSPIAWASLKALEQEDKLSYNEQVILPSSVEFVTNRERLEQFQQGHEALNPLIQALLRTYEGIFENPVRIHEKTLAWILKSDIESVKKGLQTLDAFQVIRYSPQKDNPQVFFPFNRVPANELSINLADYEKRKAAYVKRIEAMIRYVSDQQSCRSKMIGLYFGEKDAADCGRCDICVSRKQKPISAEDFRLITKEIKQFLLQQPLTISELLHKLNHHSEEHNWTVIRMLEEENKIGRKNRDQLEWTE